MDAFEIIKDRRSVKKYTDKPVPRELIEKVCRAGTWAATGMGRQSPIILAVTNKEVRDKLSEINAEVMGAKSDPFYGAPVVLVVLANKAMPTAIYDGSLVMGNMMIEAESLGLGSCWIHRAKEEFETEYGKRLLKKLGIEGEYEGIGNLILGYGDGEKPRPKPRKENYVYHID